MNLNDTPSRGPLTDADLQDWRRADMAGVDIDAVHRKFAGCHGPCDQGRKLCPCPSACSTAEIERNTDGFWRCLCDLWFASPGLRVGAVLAGSIIAAAGMLHFLIR